MSRVVPIRPGITPQPWHHHVLRDIRRSLPDSRPLQRRAAKYFANLNGWYLSSKRRYAFDQEKIYDHAIGLSRALVVQPYGHRDWTEVGEDIADRFGFALHIPPHPLASIYAPGHAAFLVFAKRDHEIKWLPEQASGIYGDAEASA